MSLKYLLIGINASFSHTCLAVRSISSYCDIPFLEFTINQPYEQILQKIIEEKSDVILFSGYIWNVDIIKNLIFDIKQIITDVVIGAGGPEFSYSEEKYFLEIPVLDFIVKGEGEETFLEIKEQKNQSLCDLYKNLEKINGIYLKKENKLFYTGQRDLICNLDDLKFPYPELLEERGLSPLSSLANKIIYYESSRGCPYSCSYCLSSIDKNVRFKSLNCVYDELQIFLDAKVPLVKFVDRTYNLNPERYINIWKYIIEHHNGITMFHFEIEAEFLTEKALCFLKTVPPGIMQFEMGVQSSNKKTLESINRSSNVEKLAENIKRIPNHIHQHVDLIAGLPYEDLKTFGNSFDFVLSLNPDAFQLGFLKILSGTQMEEYAKKNGWIWMKQPVYETLSTPYMSFSDMCFLKDVEVLVDAIWNSKKFINFLNYIKRKISLWAFFSQLAKYGKEINVFDSPKKETFWFEFLYKVINGVTGGTALPIPVLQSSDISISLLNNLLKYDFVLRGKQGGYPVWYNHIYDKQKHRELLEKNGGIKNARLDFAHSEYEVFDYDVEQEKPENFPGIYEKLIKY